MTLVTSTFTVQVLATPVLAATVIPPTVIVVAPALAVTDPPVQVFCTFGVAAIFSPEGSASMKLTTCAPLLAAGLVTVKVSVDVPPSANVVGLNALLRLGVAFTTTQLRVTASARLLNPLMFDGGLAAPWLVNAAGKLAQLPLN